MLAQYIMAISMWCGQPQTNVSDYHQGYQVRHSINSQYDKLDCQRKLLACIGPDPRGSSNKRLHLCFMGFQNKPKETLILDKLNESIPNNMVKK